MVLHPLRSSFLLALLVVSSGCLGFGGPPPSDPAAERAIDRMANASAGVDTYRVDGRGLAVAVRGDDEQRMSFTRTALVNRTAERARVTVETHDDSETAYLGSDAYYRLCHDSRYVNVEDAWYPETTIDGEWRDYDTLGTMRRTLQNASVQSAGGATVDGEDTTVVEAHLSADDVETMRRQAETGGLEVGDIESATVTVWISNETDRIVTVESDVESTVDGVTLTQETTFRYTYGGRVNVTLPRTVDSEDACPEFE
jgi:hypothetical protein